MSNKLFIALAIYVLLNPLITFSQEAQKIINHPAFDSNIRLLEAWIQSQIRYGKMPGAAVGVVYNGDLIYQKGFGNEDVENKIPATPDSRYRISSQSKVFTAIGIMILRDEGKLNLDDPIENYLSWLKLKPLQETDPPVTIRQLLTHSSGMSRDIGNHWIDFKFPTQDEFRKLTSSKKLTLVYPPYTEWKYSNNAFTLLGEIIEAVSGNSYEDFIQDKILLPLNMSATSVVQDKAYQSTLAVGYGRKMPDGSRQKFEYVDVKATAPMSGISSTVTDLAKFVAWQMRLLNQNKTEILNPNTLREMQRAQFVDEEWRWGLGFCIYHKGEDDFIGHSGWHVGYASNTAINPREKVGVIVFVNSIDGEPFHGTTWSISDRIFEWLTPAIKKATTEKTEAIQNFQEYEGQYSNIYSEFFVIFLDGKLRIVNPNSPDPKKGAWVLEPVSKNSFKIISTPRYYEVGEILVFKRNTQGKIIGFASGVGGAWSDKVD
jgi:CubicO group peptidase (beta-lactamase class C family)